MTSKIKVDNINKVSDDSNIIKKCGTTTTIGSGASNPIVVDGSAVTLGRCGGTVALASGATQTGFGRTGTVDWQTTPKTATFTAVNGEGYFVNTSGGAVTANLPAGSAGAIVAFSDYTRTFTSNNFTIAPNGSEKIGGVADTLVLGVNGQALTLVYVDGTEGWINVQNAEDTETGTVAAYITATGGTISTIGDFKYHKFTGPGTFTVTCAGNAKGSNTVQSLVVAGGGGGVFNGGGGGGAGGLRNLSCQPVTATGFPITVGSGGGLTNPGSTTPNPGSNSIFSTITSAGGGGGGTASGSPGRDGQPGGSGGGGGGNGGTATAAGAGNTPPVSPPQGNPGGANGPVPNYNAGTGGGGHTSAGSAPPSPGTPGTPGGHGGNGTDVSPSFPAPLGGSPAGFYAGGGGGGANDDGPGSGSNTPSAPGGGGIGSSGPGSTAGSGTANTGGGGGGAPTAGTTSGSGGSGIVIIKYKFQN